MCLRYALLFSLCSTLVGPILSQSDLQEPWNQGYTDKDAFGDHVRGYWHFDDPVPPFASPSPMGQFKLAGEAEISRGRFGQALCLPRRLADSNDRSSATTENHLIPRPGEGFAVEMWIFAQRELSSGENWSLIDGTTTGGGFCWEMAGSESAPLTKMVLGLSCERAKVLLNSEVFALNPQSWCHLAFVFDGNSRVRFYVNGEIRGDTTFDPSGDLIQGSPNLRIGDSNDLAGRQFEGLIDEVRLCVGDLRFEPMTLAYLMDRRVWQRMEEPHSFSLEYTNHQRQSIANAELEASFGDRSYTIPIEDVGPGETKRAKLAIDTSIKADRYALKASVRWREGQVSRITNFLITPRTRDAMPVILFDDVSDGDMPKLRSLGFTHCVAIGDLKESSGSHPVTYFRNGEPERQQAYDLMDTALAAGMRVLAVMSPSRNAMVLPGAVVRGEYAAMDRTGIPYHPPIIDLYNPALAVMAQTQAQQLAVQFRDHAAFQSIVLDSDVREDERLGFGSRARAGFLEYSGAEIPMEVESKWGVDWKQLPDFPEARVIDDNHPILTFYRWYWIEGEGLRAIHRGVAKGRERRGSGITNYFSVFRDALAQPSVGSTDLSIDVIAGDSHVMGDPSLAGYNAERLLAMSRACGHHPKVIVTTPMLIPRNRMAAADDSDRKRLDSDWGRSFPLTEWLAVPPHYLRSSLWSILSRPVFGFGFTGAGALNSDGPTGTHSNDNLDSSRELAAFVHEVLQPLGETLSLLQEPTGEIAVLESFTSQIFSGKHGWKTLTQNNGNLWQALQQAHIPARIIFEEEVQYAGVANYKFLLLPSCPVLSRSVVETLQRWQKQGGKLVADDQLCPGLKPDITISELKMNENGNSGDGGVVKIANELRKSLERAGWIPKVSADNPDVHLRVREHGDTMYVFVVNDYRKPEHHAGRSPAIRGPGMHASTQVTIHDRTGSVYDLNRNEMVLPQLTPEGTGCSWKVDLGPGEGRVFMVTPRPLLNLNVDTPKGVSTGNIARIHVTATTTQGSEFGAVLPLEIRIMDPIGREMESSGFYGMVAGKLSIDLHVASNEETGSMEVRVRELASGMQHTKWIEIVR